MAEQYIGEQGHTYRQGSESDVELKQLKENLNEERIQYAMRRVQLDDREKALRCEVEGLIRERENLESELRQTKTYVVSLQEANSVAETKIIGLTTKLQERNKYVDILNTRLANVFAEVDAE